MTLFKYVYTGGSFTEGNGAGVQLAHQDLAFVVIDVLLMFCINFWMSMMVGKARKAAGVDYPNMYAYAGAEHVYKKAAAEKEPLAGAAMSQVVADRYNSVQRAHQNTVENQPLFLTLLLFSGMGFPVCRRGRHCHSAPPFASIRREPPCNAERSVEEWRRRLAILGDRGWDRPALAAVPGCIRGRLLPLAQGAHAGGHRRLPLHVRPVRPQHRLRRLPLSGPARGVQVPLAFSIVNLLSWRFCMGAQGA
jgi:glutathione S-transferase